MQALNHQIRKNSIIYFCVCYTGMVVLLAGILYLNLRKIPELARERNQSTAVEIKNFLLETNRLDDYVRVLTKTPQPSASQLQKIFEFVTQLQAHYDKPIFQSVLKSYGAFVSDLGSARSIQDPEYAQLISKYNQLVEEKKQLDQQLDQLLQQR